MPAPRWKDAGSVASLRGETRTQGVLPMIMRMTRILGAITLGAVGAVHLQQYLGAGYNVLPTIGPLFLLNAIAAGVVAVGLLMPLERLLSERLGTVAVGLLALAGVGIAAGALVALFISESQPLFGFQEYGYNTAIKIAI